MSNERIPQTANELKLLIFNEINKKQEIIESDEQNEVTFRFNHLSTKGKHKLATLIKRKSSLITVKNTSLEKIYEILEKTNPIIINNYCQHFSLGQMPKYVEQKLSRIIFKLNTNNFNRLKTNLKNILTNTIGTGHYWNSNPRRLEILRKLQTTLGIRTEPRNTYERAAAAINTSIHNPTENEQQNSLIETRRNTTRATNCPECGSPENLIQNNGIITECLNCEYSETTNNN